MLAPTAAFAQHPLTLVSVKPERLFRVSRFRDGEPHFGRTGANRFDDPRRPLRKRFGTCYLGLGVAVAVAETVLHDEVAVIGRFQVASNELTRRNVVNFTGLPLALADCTGVALKRMGLDGRFSTELAYDVTQRWSVAIHQHPAQVDGFVFVSRHINTGQAVVLFDRAAGKLQAPHYQPLLAHGKALAALRALAVDVS